MIEQEAKTKWCPYARVRGFATEAAVNRPFKGLPSDHVDADIPDVDCRCIGSACMAWRWDDVPNPAYADYRKRRAGMMSMGYEEAPDPTIKSDTDGHCGLAGKP